MTVQAIRIVDPAPADGSREGEAADFPVIRQLRILLLKPYQPIAVPTHSPPIGLLYLASSIRAKLGKHADVRVIDMKLHHMPVEAIDPILHEFQPDVVGFSALNYEAHASHQLARHIKTINPDTITVFGGPYALKNATQILEDHCIDWVFEGAADRSFPEVLLRIAQGRQPDDSILGMSFRKPDNSVCIATHQDQINNLDSLPPPAWDMVDLDAYAKTPNMANNLKGKRYALLFTSRGCPYLCNYCHDLFSKKFVYHSVDYVITEIERLYEQYGVDEFQIVDDIFNLHKPRLKAIMGEVARRWPGKLKFTFPNGLRADILDEDVINALSDAGTYLVCVAVETVTPRLQELVEKHLDIEKTRRAIQLLGKRNVQVNGFFMLGFPTETPEEIQATIDFAIHSNLTLAYFFSVVPQPGTPMYDLAMKENPEVTQTMSQIDSGVYRNMSSWYENAYGYPLARFLRIANLRFYLSPKRGYWILTRLGLRNFWMSFISFIRMLLLNR
ncbi:MAG: B12-binding domain-containing radical SAM protein [Pseudomonadales bacterium]|nr:B12-binding domain-containing radical SAM protein [Pseudomonadales bacterium]